VYSALEIVARPDLLQKPGRDTGVVLALAETLGSAARVTLTTGPARTHAPQLIVAGEETAAFALEALVRAKRQGIATAFLPLVADPARRILGLAEQLLRATGSLFDAATALGDPSRMKMDDRSAQEWALRPAALAALAGAFVAADLVIVRDRAALSRIAAGIGRLPRTVTVFPWTIPPTVPARSRDAVVVAAPSMTAEEALPAVFAATRLARRVRLICRSNGGSVDGIEVCICAPNAPFAAWLADAATVIAPDPDDPTAAWTALSMGLPTAVAIGADVEIPPEVPRFLANDAHSAMQALERVEALRPLATPKPDPAGLLAMWERVATVPSVSASDAPLVSIITPTYNRPDLLIHTLESIAAQRYPNIESVVVNDAGTDVQHVVDRFAGRLRIRYVRHERNRGLSAALNTGIAHATGAYIGYCDDDDVLYPDHVARLMHAIRARGARAAYADALLVNQRLQDGTLTDVGYDFQYAQPFDIVKFLALNLFPNLAVIHERALCDEIGPYDETLPVLMDYDYWLRIAMRTPFLHVESLTAEFHQRADGSNMTVERGARFVEARRVVYGRVRDVAARHPDALRQQQALTGVTTAPSTSR